MEKHCPHCGIELNSDAKFCQYCGVALDDSPKLKNEVLSGKAQARFLTVLAFGLIALVLGVYLFRNAQPADIAQPAVIVELIDNAQTSEMAEITGDWVGGVYRNDVLIYRYTLTITENASEIRGTAITSVLDETASADALIIGSYSNGNLSFQEYGGDESGTWEDENMCFWEFDLVLEHINGEAVLTGSYDAIDCNSSGTVILRRPE